MNRYIGEKYQKGYTCVFIPQLPEFKLGEIIGIKSNHI